MRAPKANDNNVNLLPQHAIRTHLIESTYASRQFGRLILLISHFGLLPHVDPKHLHALARDTTLLSLQLAPALCSLARPTRRSLSLQQCSPTITTARCARWQGESARLLRTTCKPDHRHSVVTDRHQRQNLNTETTHRCARAHTHNARITTVNTCARVSYVGRVGPLDRRSRARRRRRLARIAEIVAQHWLEHVWRQTHTRCCLKATLHAQCVCSNDTPLATAGTFVDESSVRADLRSCSRQQLMMNTPCALSCQRYSSAGTSINCHVAR
jgi:hypothetical protein